MWHPHCKSVSTDISARQGRICFVECLRKRTFMAARHSSTQSVPISRTNCGISVSSVCLTLSISDKHSSTQYAKAPGKKKSSKNNQRKRRELKPSEQSGGLRINKTNKWRKHGNWAVVGDTVSGHRELTAKHIPHLNFCC